MSLFREEVFSRKSEKLHGTINLAVPVSWQVIALALTGILVVAGVFLSTASYSRTETAVGSIVPERGILQIVPVRAGRVETVAVAEGQTVQSGTTLARIRVEETDRSGAGAQAAVLTAIDTQYRSLGQQEEWGRAESVSERAGYAAQIDGLRNELATIDAQISVQEKLVAMAQTELKQASEIAGRGFISRRDIATREETVLSRQQQLASLLQNRAAKIASIAQAGPAQRQATARSSAAVAALANNRAQIERERAGARAEQGYSLIAPAKGSVAALSLHVGDAVTPQDIAMVIVPAGGRLIARLYIPGKAAGFVRPGQTVRLALDAYPFDRFGTVSGVITTVSSAPVLRQEPGGNSAPFYVATATMRDPSLRAYGRRETLLPGMTLNARITTEKRSLLEWLFDPLYAAARQ